MQIYSP